MPAGPFAPAAYEALLDALDSEIKVRKKDARAAGLQRVSLPGFIIAKTRLANHMAVPVVAPDLRAMFRWTADALVKAQVKAMAAGATPPPEEGIDCGRRVASGCDIGDWLKCAGVVAGCAVACCGGACIGSPACIACLGGAYGTCSQCF